MEKAEIHQLVSTHHQSLIEFLNTQPLEKWEYGPEGKWTTGQQLLHLIQSTQALNKGLSMPRFILKYKFGTCNRTTREYDQVVTNYREKLKKAQGFVPPFSGLIKIPVLPEKEMYMDLFDREIRKLLKKFKKWKPADIDKYLLPHPLMGRMTIREIVMWSAYHIVHHTDQLKNAYS